jgi:adenylate kinase
MNSANAESLVKIPKHDRTAWLKGGDFFCLMPPRIPRRRPLRLVLLGAPGVGKGTQAEMIHEFFGACQLSTGDVFRDAKNSCETNLSTTSRAALDFMRRGELVPDATVLDIVAERARCLRCSGGFLLDGFPRTVAQAEALEKLLEREKTKLDAVINYEMPIAKIVARLSGRRVCSHCKAVYHLASQPSQCPNICDRCGAKLIQREDDRPESVQVRMAAYEKSTRPLIDFYLERKLLRTINATGTPGEIFHRTCSSVLGE